MRINYILVCVPLALMSIAGAAVPSLTQAQDFAYVSDNGDRNKSGNRHWREKPKSNWKHKHHPEQHWRPSYRDNYYSWPNYVRPFGLYYAPPVYVAPPGYYVPYYPPGYAPSYGHRYPGPNLYFEYSR